VSRLLPTCILAGGLGTRLGGRVRYEPKPLLEVAGKPFLWHQLRLLAAGGADEVVLCVGYLGEQIKQRIGTDLFGLRISYSFDDLDLDGTLGAIRRARDLLGERFLVLYGDTYLRIDYAAAARAWQQSGLPAMMSVLHNEGRWEASNAVYDGARVVAYDKHHPQPDMQWIDYGLGGLEQRALDRVPADTGDLSVLYHELAGSGLLCGVEASERFYEIGTPDTLAETDAFLRSLETGRRSPAAIVRALRTRTGLVGQGARYALAGSLVALVYMLTTTVLAIVARLHFQLALAIGFGAALAVHFTLQRWFVWADRGDFALPLRLQTARYLLASGTQYGLTAGATSLLPAMLGLPVEAVYLVTVTVVACANFLVFRHLVFHPAASPAQTTDRRSCESSRGPALDEAAAGMPPRATDPIAR